MSVANCAPDVWCGRCTKARTQLKGGQWMPGRIKSERARNVILSVCLDRNVTTVGLFGRRRTRQLARAREAVARLLIAECVTDSQTQIARWLGRHPSTVNAMLHREATP